MYNKRSTAGFSLIELLIVIVVLAILTLITFVAYNDFARRAQTSSLKNDMQTMDLAQKRYMAQSNNPPISYNGSGEPNDTLAFIATKDNSIIVKLKEHNQYCVYGYNPKSHYPDPEHSLVRSSDSTSCEPLTTEEVDNPDGALSTVAIIGQRLEEFHQLHGYYPTLDRIIDIGLIIKPNNDQATQQQLYCRNDSDAIYLQLDKDDDIVYVYVTASHSIAQPVIDGKLSLNTVCEQYDINEGDPGYESTGIKTPDF